MGEKEFKKLKNKAERESFRKLKALRKIGEHIGMYGKIRINPDKANKKLGLIALANIFSEKSTIIQKITSGFILDYYAPGWREKVPKEILSPMLDRDNKKVLEWRKEVFKRDGHKCVKCGSTDNLEAHHIIPWSVAPELRINLNNGETLCNSCHADEHIEIKNFILSNRKR